MWHFGRDSLIEISGKDFHRTIDRAEHTLERLYSKDLKGKHITRRETSECPNKNPYEAIEQKLNCMYPDSSKQLPQLGTYQESE